jgi:hypothetical protein
MTISGAPRVQHSRSIRDVSPSGARWGDAFNCGAVGCVGVPMAVSSCRNAEHSAADGGLASESPSQGAPWRS